MSKYSPDVVFSAHHHRGAATVARKTKPDDANVTKVFHVQTDAPINIDITEDR